MTAWPAGDNIQSANLIAAATVPTIVPTQGEGRPGDLITAEDYVAVTSSVAQYSFYALGPRIPTTAKVKKVSLYTKGIDSNASNTATLDINVQMSEAPIAGNPVIANTALSDVQDGTNPNSAGGIPTTALNGTLLADPLTESAYTGGSPNKLFGSGVTLAASGAYQVKDITHANTFTYAMKQQPLWALLGFTNNAGVAADPGGYVQFFVVVAAAVATAAAGFIGIEVQYVD